MSWEDFYVQSKRDYKCSEILARNKYFENSAYLLQQCVEKSLKAMILKLDSRANPRDFGHLPLIGLLGQLNNQFHRTYRHSQDKNIKIAMRQVAFIVPKLQAVLRYIKNEGWEAGWTKSLGIKFSGKEHTAMTRLIEDLKIVQESMMQKIYPVFEDYRISLTQQSGSSLLARLLLPLTTIKLQLDKSSGTYRVVNSVNGCEVNMYELLLPPFICMYNVLQNEGKSTEELSLLIIAMFLGTHTDIMIDTFAHEAIGRYPCTIGGKNSISLYEAHSDNLKQLSKKVKKHLEYTKLVFEQ